MLTTLKSFLARHCCVKSGSKKRTDLLQVVALLIRAATSDAEFGTEERDAIRRIAAEYFGLSAEEVSSLVAAAEERKPRPWICTAGLSRSSRPTAKRNVSA